MSTPYGAWGRICAADFIPVEEEHPVEWLRGKVTITIAVDVEDVRGIRIGDSVHVEGEHHE